MCKWATSSVIRWASTDIRLTVSLTVPGWWVLQLRRRDCVQNNGIISYSYPHSHSRLGLPIFLEREGDGGGGEEGEGEMGRGRWGKGRGRWSGEGEGKVGNGNGRGRGRGGGGGEWEGEGEGEYQTISCSHKLALRTSDFSPYLVVDSCKNGCSYSHASECTAMKVLL